MCAAGAAQSRQTDPLVSLRPARRCLLGLRCRVCAAEENRRVERHTETVLADASQSRAASSFYGHHTVPRSGVEEASVHSAVPGGDRLAFLLPVCLDWCVFHRNS